MTPFFTKDSKNKTKQKNCKQLLKNAGVSRTFSSKYIDGKATP